MAVLNTRHMIVERTPFAGRVIGQRNGVQGSLLRQQPPAHLSALPLQVWCLPTAASRLSAAFRHRFSLMAGTIVGAANDKAGRLQAGRPAVWLGTVGRKAGTCSTYCGAVAGSPEAPRG